MAEQKLKQQILIVDFTEEGVGGERHVSALRYAFPTVTVDHITELRRMHAALRCTAYTLVVIVADYQLSDVEHIAKGICEAQFLRFDGETPIGTSVGTPIIILVPGRHIFAFPSTPHVQCVSMSADVQEFLNVVAQHGIVRQTATDSSEVDTVVSVSPGEKHHRPTSTHSA